MCTTPERDLILETFYGIDPATYAVESIGLTRSGVLQKQGPDGKLQEHPLVHGRSPQTEIVTVWHLRDVISFRERQGTPEARDQLINELRARATKMKKENENTLGG